VLCQGAQTLHAVARTRRSTESSEVIPTRNSTSSKTVLKRPRLPVGMLHEVIKKALTMVCNPLCTLGTDAAASAFMLPIVCFPFLTPVMRIVANLFPDAGMRQVPALLVTSPGPFGAVCHVGEQCPIKRRRNSRAFARVHAFRARPCSWGLTTWLLVTTCVRITRHAKLLLAVSPPTLTLSPVMR